MQDPCLFWQWKQNKKSHPEFSIPKGGASQEKQSFAAAFPLCAAQEQRALGRETQCGGWGRAPEIPAGVGRDHLEVHDHLVLVKKQELAKKKKSGVRR